MIVGIPALHYMTWRHWPARHAQARRAAVSRPAKLAPPPSSAPAGRFAIPARIVACESGGNYRAVNPTTGAGGAYQIMPATWLAYGGTGLPENASPAEQSAIAAKIWASAGPAAWSCK